MNITNKRRWRLRIKDRLPTAASVFTLAGLILSAIMVTGQTGVHLPNGLKPGEKLSERIWKQALEQRILPQGKKTFSPDALNGKLVILAFWSTDCSSSAEELLRFDSLQKKFPDVFILGVTKQTAAQIQSYPGAISNLRELSIPILTSDMLLQPLFPHQTVPHIVWIDKERRYRSATYSEYLNAATIREALSGGSMKWPQKENLPPYDYAKPLAAFSSASGASQYYSFLGSYVPGASTREGFVPDSGGAAKRYYAINHSIMHLYAMAYGRGDLVFTPSRRMLNVRNLGKYEYSPELGYRQAWEQANHYSYECRLPLSSSQEEIRLKLRRDLDAMLGLRSSIETRKIQVLVLQKQEGKKPFPSSHNQTKIALGAAAGKPFLHRGTIDNLVIALNRTPGYPPVLDESGITAPLDLEFKKPLADLEAVREGLSRQGLLLLPQERELEMFVLSENSFTISHSSKK